VATDPQGMVQAMASLQATLQQMHDAYIQASTNYQETNEQIADVLKKIDPDYKPPVSGNGTSAPANPPSTGATRHFN
jgi:hypothetical protein